MRTYYEMFSDAGNKACVDLVNKLCKKIEGKKRLTQDEVTKIVKEGMDKIESQHPEVYDTEPHWHIVDAVNKKCKEVGYAFTIGRFDF